MLTYRTLIYSLAMETSGAAIALGLSLSNCVALSRSPDYEVALLEELPTIDRQAADLKNAVTGLLEAFLEQGVAGNPSWMVHIRLGLRTSGT